jgi:hypothetical protein
VKLLHGRETSTVRAEVNLLINNGIFDQNEIFNRLYPTYIGHYSKLRDLIAEVKNDGP